MWDFIAGLMLIIIGLFFLGAIRIFSVEIYGDRWDDSIQFFMLILGILILMTLSSLGFFGFYSNFVKSLFYSSVELMFTTFITITIGIIGIIGVICSIIFGNLYVYYMEMELEGKELKKKKLMTIRQGIIWIFFCMYFLLFMLFLFIIPLFFRL
jgi:hypothetical protein